MTTAGGVQHCPRCAAEYVAGVGLCADCGSPLVPGPLVDSPPPGRPQEAGLPDVLLATVPGLQADLLASSLTMEGIACLLECDGMSQLRQPGGDSPGALAATLPVDVYVGRLDLDRARDVRESIEQGEVIGDQWQSAETRANADGGVQDDAALVPVPPAASAALSGDSGQSRESRPESTTLRLLFLVAVAVTLAFAWLRC